jgi:hypothetical protein
MPHDTTLIATIVAVWFLPSSPIAKVAARPALDC